MSPAVVISTGMSVLTIFLSLICLGFAERRFVVSTETQPRDRLSAIGTSGQSGVALTFGGKADIPSCTANVCFYRRDISAFSFLKVVRAAPGMNFRAIRWQARWSARTQ